MISSLELQHEYVDLYKLLREYVWDYQTVEHIADLEVAVYEAFVDLNSVRKCLQVLRRDVNMSQLSDPKDIFEMIDSMLELTKDTNQYYSLYSVQEELINEDSKEDKSREGKHSGKKRIKNARIRRRE